MSRCGTTISPLGDKRPASMTSWTPCVVGKRVCRRAAWVRTAVTSRRPMRRMSPKRSRRCGICCCATVTSAFARSSWPRPGTGHYADCVRGLATARCICCTDPTASGRHDAAWCSIRPRVPRSRQRSQMSIVASGRWLCGARPACRSGCHAAVPLEQVDAALHGIAPLVRLGILCGLGRYADQEQPEHGCRGRRSRVDRHSHVILISYRIAGTADHGGAVASG
jgi:hypothetical protein